MARWPRILLTLPAASARLLVMLALLLLPLGGHPVAMAACDPAEAAAQPVAAPPAAHHDHAGHHGGDQGDAADTAAGTGADHDLPAKARASQALCCLSTCPACLWQDVSAPSAPLPLRLAGHRPPAETPVPPGFAPSPALDPPRTPA